MGFRGKSSKIWKQFCAARKKMYRQRHDKRGAKRGVETRPLISFLKKRVSKLDLFLFKCHVIRSISAMNGTSREAKTNKYTNLLT